MATAVCALAVPQKAKAKLSMLTTSLGFTTICTESEVGQFPDVVYFIVCIPGPAVNGVNSPVVPSIPEPLQVPPVVVLDEYVKLNAGASEHTAGKESTSAISTSNNVNSTPAVSPHCPALP